VPTWPLPYHIENGGIYLKDAAVLAGLGTIGRNNLLITPEFGPRVRLRALLAGVDLPPTGPAGFDPCEGCPAPCLTDCLGGPSSRMGMRKRIPVRSVPQEEAPPSAATGATPRCAPTSGEQAPRAGRFSTAGGASSPAGRLRFIFWHASIQPLEPSKQRNSRKVDLDRCQQNDGLNAMSCLLFELIPWYLFIDFLHHLPENIIKNLLEGGMLFSMREAPFFIVNNSRNSFHPHCFPAVAV